VLFHFDPAKSEANRAKHGIDFVEAQQLWKYRAVIVRSDRGNERPFARIARHIDGKLYTAIFTMRGQAIRIISVRRARQKEVELYGKKD
jgi:hypothetical protein